jgi:hypothetical protein
VFFRNITAGLDPDIIMAGVGRHKKKFFSQKLFYKQAAAGTLPSFSWLSPPLQACDHPCQSHPARRSPAIPLVDTRTVLCGDQHCACRS